MYKHFQYNNTLITFYLQNKSRHPVCGCHTTRSYLQTYTGRHKKDRLTVLATLSGLQTKLF